MNHHALSNNITQRFAITLRVILGGLFIWTGCAKLLDLGSFIDSIGHFEISPFDKEPWDMWLGYTLPAFEVIIGSFLILAILYRGALLSTLAMSILFLAAVYYAQVRGLNIECGCLGKSLSFGNYYIHIAILAAMTVATISLIIIELATQKKPFQGGKKYNVRHLS